MLKFWHFISIYRQDSQTDVLLVYREECKFMRGYAYICQIPSEYEKTL